MEEFDRCVSELLRHHACQSVCFSLRVCQGKSYIHLIPTNPLLKNCVPMKERTFLLKKQESLFVIIALIIFDPD